MFERNWSNNNNSTVTVTKDLLTKHCHLSSDFLLRVSFDEHNRSPSLGSEFVKLLLDAKGLLFLIKLLLLKSGFDVFIFNFRTSSIRCVVSVVGEGSRFVEHWIHWLLSEVEIKLMGFEFVSLSGFVLWSFLIAGGDSILGVSMIGVIDAGGLKLNGKKENPLLLCKKMSIF